MFYAFDMPYTGAPDECSICWPTKLVDGRCPNEGCRYNPQIETKSSK